MQVAEALAERAKRVYEKYGTVMVNLEGFSRVGVGGLAGFYLVRMSWWQARGWQHTGVVWRLTATVMVNLEGFSRVGVVGWRWSLGGLGSG